MLYYNNIASNSLKQAFFSFLQKVKFNWKKNKIMENKEISFVKVDSIVYQLRWSKEMENLDVLGLSF